MRRVIVLSAPCNFLVQRFQNLDSKDLGLWDLGLKNDRSSRKAGGWQPTGPTSGRERDRCLSTALSYDIHTHTPAQKSSTNFILYPFVVQRCSTNWLGHGHGFLGWAKPLETNGHTRLPARFTRTLQRMTPDVPNIVDFGGFDQAQS